MNKIELARLDQVGRGATIKIAASNATDKSKLAADYICDGTADETEINAAIAELATTGGSIELSEGTFALSNFISINQNNIWLKGQGFSTKIIESDYHDAIKIAQNKTVKISDLYIKSNAYGVYVDGTALITNCKIVSTEGRTVYISNNSVKTMVVNNYLAGSQGAYADSGGTSTLIANNL